MRRFALGLDYGTSSVRAVLSDVEDGSEVASEVSPYAGGEAGVLYDTRDPNLARQEPAVYGEGFARTVSAVMEGIDPIAVVGIGIDTTGSTPLPVDASGTPLALDPRWADELAAKAWLWKDHTAAAEAEEITALARHMGVPYLGRCGGAYSSEWFWSKVLRCARVAPEAFAAAAGWIECADYVPALATGSLGRPARGICAAGHKAMYSRAWGGLPSAEFLGRLDPRLAALRGRLEFEPKTSDQAAGGLAPEWAARTGLRAGTPVAVGGFDAHFGAVGAGVRAGTLVKIMGTSTCDCLVHPLDAPLAEIPGLCGVVEGSILPDAYGLEAGQSAVGDLFAWFADFSNTSLADLSAAASASPPGGSGLLALDWNNGNRSILVDPLLSGLLLGQSLRTTPGEVFRALVEATAFGAMTIVERLEEYGVRVHEVIACGGIADQSPLAMQVYADVLDRPIRVSDSAQTCALGGAIFGAVAGGAHPSVSAAQAAMAAGCKAVYRPEPGSAAIYQQLYRLYTKLHDEFGRPDGAMAGVMKELLALRMRSRLR